jgi:hypothetical protein
MATYIPGMTDYIPQVQPFQPDLNFYANVMQTKQGRFDSAKRKINELYGTLLNSPMSRDSNIKRREEFFKIIDQDIKKISGLDLSLEQNVDQAMNVFSGFYDDKYMVSDMVKTKNYFNELEKAQNYRNCNNPEKCNGQYWDAGVQKLQYKMDEFKKVSDNESLNFQIGSFDPYFDWKKDAAKKAKEQGYDVKQDTVSGRWIVRDSNGKLVQGGLENFFTSLYGDDPRVKANYETQAYVTRKNYAASNAAQFGSEEEAEKQYITNHFNKGLEEYHNTLNAVIDGYNQVSNTLTKLERKKNGPGLTPQEKEAYTLATQQKQYLEKSKSTVQGRIDEIQNNINTEDLNSLRRRVDLSVAGAYEKSDIVGLAESLANLKKEHTLEVNPYAKMYEEFGLQKKLADHNALLDVWKMKHEFGYKVKLEELKNAKKTGQLPGAIPGTEGYEIKGAPWSNVKENLDENPSLIYDRNIQERNAKMESASALSSGALLQLVQAAQNAYKANPNENSGAASFLSQFGKNAGNIKTIAELQQAIKENKQTPISLFNGLVSQASMKQNPTGDYDWARGILNQKGGMIDQVRFANEAFHATLNDQLNTNKRIAKTIEGTLSTENQVARHAGLLVSNSGFLESEDTFVKKYIKANADRNIMASPSKAKEAYQALTKQFFSTYNSAAETSLRQGEGLAGSGMISATPIQFTGLDLLDKGTNKVVTDIISTTNQALNTQGTTTVVIGDPSKESLKQESNTAVGDFLTWYLNQADLTDKSKNRSFSAVVSNIAGEDPTKAAITFKGIDPDVIKQYTGSEKDPKVFFGQDLSKGITVFFDKTQQINPFEKPMSDQETILRLNGHTKSTGFEDLAGTVDWSYDKNTNRVRAVHHPAYFDKGKWVPAGTPQVLVDKDMANLDESVKYVNQTLENLAKVNMQIGANIANATRGQQ